MNKIMPILATILAVGAMAAVTFAVIAPMAYAQTSTTSFTVSQSSSNNCSGAGNCSNTGTITVSINRPPTG
jgi:capsular polysaccharide biosynthesis protein